jgi:hypothetical protein
MSVSVSSNIATSPAIERARTSTLPSVMYTLSGFARRLIDADGESRDVTLAPGEVRWLNAQTHSGENIGETPTHVLFVELKDHDGRVRDARPATLGPS